MPSHPTTGYTARDANCSITKGSLPMTGTNITHIAQTGEHPNNVLANKPRGLTEPECDVLLRFAEQQDDPATTLARFCQIFLGSHVANNIEYTIHDRELISKTLQAMKVTDAERFDLDDGAKDQKSVSAYDDELGFIESELPTAALAALEVSCFTATVVIDQDVFAPETDKRLPDLKPTTGTNARLDQHVPCEIPCARLPSPATPQQADTSKSGKSNLKAMDTMSRHNSDESGVSDSSSAELTEIKKLRAYANSMEGELQNRTEELRLATHQIQGLKAQNDFVWRRNVKADLKIKGLLAKNQSLEGQVVQQQHAFDKAKVYREQAKRYYRRARIAEGKLVKAEQL